MAGDPAAFPADLGDGVVVHVGGAGEDGVGGEAEEGAGAELDGSGEVVAGGDEDFAAAEDGAAVDGLLDGGGVLGGAVAGGAVVADVETKVGGFGRGLGVGLGFGGGSANSSAGARLLRAATAGAAKRVWPADLRKLRRWIRLPAMRFPLVLREM